VRRRLTGYTMGLRGGTASARETHDRPTEGSMYDWRADWQDRFGRTEPKIVCVGLNYTDHAAEQGAKLPPNPMLFAKFANALIGDGEDIRIAPGIGHVDAEAELCVVIGREAHDVPADDALDVVHGYLCGNDVSARDLQFGDKQWFRGKSQDTFCPVGPLIVPVSELGDASDLRVTQRLNGETLQDSRTSNLIFDVRTLVAFISHALTLLPGDLVMTGTPEGVGVFREPRLSMKHGDVVEVEVEGVGVLRNQVREAGR
jgi:2-keto-4-pentenoate hydratase/2-oxohepta-3-ene-1,7-dioic acid hydratase in catechol pathway